MFMSREIMHCKPGKVKPMVEKMKVIAEALKAAGYPPLRIYTDVSGEKYWTVVSEQDIKGFDEMGETSRKIMSDPKVSAAMKDYHDLVIEGRRELYKVE